MSTHDLMEKPVLDVEFGKYPKAISWRKLLLDQGVLTQEIVTAPYDGAGTEEDPYVVEWIENDPRNPMTWKSGKKWLMTMIMAIATLSVAFCSSAFSGGAFSISQRRIRDSANQICRYSANINRVQYFSDGRNSRYLPLRPRIRPRSATMGSSLRNIWPSSNFLHYIYCLHRVQCRRSWLSKYLDTSHFTILGRLIWLQPSHKCRWCHCRPLLG